ncbi:hypothetical protein GCM10009817_27540 [Terrabacter lapilli]|uniref:DUF4825 domain-containing protein n=1 Tax=Terrabacter lapilli TaxID=436231 RepID=A0ABP5DU24_9MICO
MNRRATRSRAAGLIIAASLVAVPLTGCSVNASAGAGVDAESDALWAHRTPYVGDSNKALALIADTNFGPPRSYSIKLQTVNAPYDLTVTFPTTEVDGKPLDAIDFTPAATKLLGTIGNLDSVTVTSNDTPVFTLTAKQASKTLGFNVKQLGQDKRKLTDYVASDRD